MMKYVNDCSRHLNTLVYLYLATAYFMHSRDVIARSYAYSYDVFYRCTNPHRVETPTTSFVSTSSIHSMHHPLHHSSLHFLQSPTIFHMSANIYVVTPSSLHLKRLLVYYLTPNSLLLFHISMLCMVVLSILLPLKQVPSIITFPPSSLPLIKIIIQTLPTFVSIFIDYNFFSVQPSDNPCK